MFSRYFKTEDQKINTHSGSNSVSRVAAYGAGIMMREEVFAKAGTVVPMHGHYHEQICYITRGSAKIIFEDGKEVVLSAGEAAYFGPYEKHSVVMLEDDTAVMDAFTPIRVDHLEAKDN
ncbi:MAG: cupin domain-containing protein [Clostridia bacterium]|nr:cupin domain-containing protein [Clostridia bacterium]